MVFLAIALVAPSVFAKDGRPAQSQPRHAQQVGLLGNLWSFITRFLPAQGTSGTFDCLVGDSGCRIDPWGNTENQNTDEGCRMDLLGLCGPTQNIDEGCRLDPWGLCVTGQ